MAMDSLTNVMPPIEAENLETEPVKEVAPASKATIGIIYPPPEVRNIVDKTASFVARNGPEFEARIRQNEINNPKFNFLNSSDPYHAYYQHKVKDFQEGKGVEPTFKPQPQSTTLAQQKPEQLKIIEQNIVPKEPPPDYEFIIDPPSISAFDLDVVKLTAQFVARNGRQFLTNLMNREQKNYQFDFLRPQHSLFTYFTKLVEQYTKILIPPKDLLPKLRKEADNFKLVNEKVKQRVDWARYQERERKKEEDERERERVAYAQIDWHDFVVVETVDFQPGETGNFPPPTTPQEVGARVVQQERFDRNEPKEDGVGMDVTSDDEGREAESSEEEEEAEERPPKPSHPGRPQPPAPVHPGDDTQVQDMEEASDEENSDEESQPRKHSAPPPAPPQSLPPLPPKDQLPQPPPLPPNPEQVIVRKGYDPKAPKAVPTAASEDMWVSPLTGEKIAPDKIQEHVRIGLLNPKWIEQRDRAIREKQEQEEVLARGTSIEQSLKRLAERRTDIFGIGVEELQIGRKIGEEEIRQQSKVIWDGHTASMEKVTQKARENISIEEQIATIHKVQGLVQDEAKERIGPSVPKAPAPPVAPPPQPPQPTPPISAPRPPPPSASQSAAGAPYQPMPPRPIAPPIPPQGIAFGLAPAPHIMMQPLGGIQPPPAILGLAPGIPTIIPPRPPQPGFMMPQPQLGQKRPGVPVVEEESSGKKAKTEEQLIPEDVFLQSNKGPVTIKVQIPNVQDKSDMKLNGQTISMSLPLTDSVAVIKAKLHDEVGLPAGKQKLQQDGLFMKDSNTLAFYNLTNNCVVQLQLKERGGRKK